MNPLTKGSDGGRNPNGTFAKGWKGGPGNPLAGRVAKLRAALLKTVRPADIAEIIAALMRQAKGGDVAACKLVLGYAVGEPLPWDVLAEIETLREQLAELEQWRGETNCGN